MIDEQICALLVRGISVATAGDRFDVPLFISTKEVAE
jgi:hypothetical protein